MKPLLQFFHSISTAYRSNCILTELLMFHYMSVVYFAWRRSLKRVETSTKSYTDFFKQWQSSEKTPGLFRCVHEGWRNRDSMSLRVIWEWTDWVRFGRETGRWITCGRQSEAAWRVSRWEESRRCGRLWEEKVAGVPKDIALPYVAIAIRNSLRARVCRLTFLLLVLKSLYCNSLGFCCLLFLQEP